MLAPLRPPSSSSEAQRERLVVRRLLQQTMPQLRLVEQRRLAAFLWRWKVWGELSGHVQVQVRVLVRVQVRIPALALEVVIPQLSREGMEPLWVLLHTGHLLRPLCSLAPALNQGWLARPRLSVLS